MQYKSSIPFDYMKPELDFCVLYVPFLYFHKPDMPDPGLAAYAGDIKDFD